MRLGTTLLDLITPRYALGGTFRLEELSSQVERQYLHRAMEQAACVKKVASDLLGYRDTNQKLNKRLAKHGLIQL